ncbi:hypothetical protein ACHQM5_009244 [Ranunculus cassubicifolius]
MSTFGDGPSTTGKSFEEHGHRSIKLYLDTTSSKSPYVCSNFIKRFQTSTDSSGGSELKARSNKARTFLSSFKRHKKSAYSIMYPGSCINLFIPSSKTLCATFGSLSRQNAIIA